MQWSSLLFTFGLSVSLLPLGKHPNECGEKVDSSPDLI